MEYNMIKEYSNHFIKSINLLLIEECGFTKDGKSRVDIDGGLNHIKEDKGGVTKFGISYRFLKSIDDKSTEDDIINLTKDDAIQLAYEHFYKKYNYHRIDNYELSNKLFNTCYNMGSKKPNRNIQIICNELLPHNEHIIDVDGVLGDISINLINRFTVDNMDYIKSKFTEYQIHDYNTIVERNPSQKIILKGWIERAKKW